jgi:hypothetical protein
MKWKSCKVSSHTQAHKFGHDGAPKPSGSWSDPRRAGWCLEARWRDWVVGNGCVQAVSDSTPSSLHTTVSPAQFLFFARKHFFGRHVCGCVHAPHTELSNPHSAFPTWIAAFPHHRNIPKRAQTSWDSSSLHAAAGRVASTPDPSSLFVFVLSSGLVGSTFHMVTWSLQHHDSEGL